MGAAEYLERSMSCFVQQQIRWIRGQSRDKVLIGDLDGDVVYGEK